MPRRRIERRGRERAAKDQRRRAEFVEPGFEVGADEGACRVADDDDLAIERRGRSAASSVVGRHGPAEDPRPSRRR